MAWVPGYVYPADLSRVLVFQRQVPVRPSRCTATSTAPGAEARPHDGLACQVSAATVPGRAATVGGGDKNPKLNLFLEEKQVFPLRKSSAFGLVRKGEINFDKI